MWRQPKFIFLLSCAIHIKVPLSENALFKFLPSWPALLSNWEQRFCYIKGTIWLVASIIYCQLSRLHSTPKGWIKILYFQAPLAATLVGWKQIHKASTFEMSLCCRHHYILKVKGKNCHIMSISCFFPSRFLKPLKIETLGGLGWNTKVSVLLMQPD